MTVEEIIKNGRFIEHKVNPEYSSLELDFYIEFFEEPVSILVENILDTESGPKATRLKEMLNYLINLDSKHKSHLKEIIWKHYNSCIENIGYGMVNYEGFDNHKKANQAHFKIYNEEDAFSAVELKTIYLDMDFSNSCIWSYKCPWENEHGLTVSLENGKMELAN